MGKNILLCSVNFIKLIENNMNGIDNQVEAMLWTYCI